MKNLFIILGLALVAAVVADTTTNEIDSGDAENFNSKEDVHEPDNDETFMQAGENGNVLLMEWVPNPINEYRYAEVNVTYRYTTQQGQMPLEKFTQDEFPDVSVIFTPVFGDADYVFTNINAPVLSIEAFRDDEYFMNYQDIIYTMHGFQNKVELWEHFLENLDAFSPVQSRLTNAFENYVNNMHGKGNIYSESSESSSGEKEENATQPDDFEIGSK